jgi:hypothetical protein
MKLTKGKIAKAHNKNKQSMKKYKKKHSKNHNSNSKTFRKKKATNLLKSTLKNYGMLGGANYKLKEGAPDDGNLENYEEAQEGATHMTDENGKIVPIPVTGEATDVNTSGTEDTSGEAAAAEAADPVVPVENTTGNEGASEVNANDASEASGAVEDTSGAAVESGEVVDENAVKPPEIVSAVVNANTADSTQIASGDTDAGAGENGNQDFAEDDETENYDEEKPNSGLINKFGNEDVEEEQDDEQDEDEDEANYEDDEYGEESGQQQVSNIQEKRVQVNAPSGNSPSSSISESEKALLNALKNTIREYLNKPVTDNFSGMVNTFAGSQG